VSEPHPQPNLADYLTIGEAAEFLGVSPWTLRNWDRAGKLRTLRHPKNGYRIYRREDLAALLPPEGNSGRLSSRLSPHFDWSAVGESDHLVQFYERDNFLVGSVSRFLGSALAAGEGAILIATRTHRNAVQRQLRARGLDLSAARAHKQFVALDAAETLAKFLVDGAPDEERFRAVMGEVIAQVGEGRPHVKTFGEMVALLWAEGNRPGAIRLEELWNGLQKTHTFALFCAYPIHGFSGENQEAPFARVCTCHSHVIPTESFVTIPGESERLQAIAQLQQKAQTQDAEEEQADKARALLAAIVESSQDAIVSKTLDGIILSWNAGAERLFGYSAEEAVGRPITLLIPPERHDEEALILSRLRRGERIESYETVRVARDGRRLYVSLTISPVRDSTGRIIAASKVARDITGRKRAEQRRSAQLAVTQALANSGSIEEVVPLILRAVCEHLGWDLGAFWLLDPHADTLRCLGLWHPPAVQVEEFKEKCRTNAFSPGVGLPGRVWASGEPAWIRDTTADLNFPRAPVAARDGLQTAFACPILLGSEVLGVIEIFSREVRDRDAELLEMVASLGSQVGQFMERRRTEQGLRRNEERLRFLAEASVTLGHLLDYESTLRTVAGLAIPFLADCCLLDLLEEEGRIQRVSAVRSSAGQENLAGHLAGTYRVAADAPSPVAQVLRGGRPVLIPQVREAHLDALAIDPAGQAVWQELMPQSCVCVPLSVRDRLLGALVFLARGRRYEHADLALAEELARRAAVAIDNAQLYQDARDAERRKDLFLSQLAHELRGPLAPLSNALEVFQRLGVGGETVEKVRGMMGRQIEQLTRLVDDLLDLSRIGQGKIQLRKEVVDVAAVVNRAVEIAKPLIESRHHELTLTLPGEPLRLEVDPARLVQVLANLLTNAAKYTEEGGRIWLTAAQENGEIVLRVRDTGTGIPREMLPRVFELFTQLDRPLERGQGGLGIGLALVKNLVHMHGGTVEAHSDGPGRGSEFTVRLPANVKAAAVRRGLMPGRPLTRGPALRVLICDDNRDAVDSLAMLLGMWGHEVHKAHDGPTALKLTAACRMDAVLLDIGLPGGMDGYEVVRRLRQAGTGAYLVALTGFGGPDDRQRSQEAGFDHHMVKPVDLADLQELLTSLVRAD
jgi:PAS domain S-box-containing protein